MPNSTQNAIRTVGRVSGWVALALLLLAALTGYGITQFRIVQPLTGGILNKAVSQQSHHIIDIPLLFITVLHVGIAVWTRLSYRRKKKDET